MSMGANAATKTFKVVENVEKILSIELMNATQALEFRRPLKSSTIIENIIHNYRKLVSTLTEDRILFTDISSSIQFLRNEKLPSLD